MKALGRLPERHNGETGTREPVSPDEIISGNVSIWNSSALVVCIDAVALVCQLSTVGVLILGLCPDATALWATLLSMFPRCSFRSLQTTIPTTENLGPSGCRVTMVSSSTIVVWPTNGGILSVCSFSMSTTTAARALLIVDACIAGSMVSVVLAGHLVVIGHFRDGNDNANGGMVARLARLRWVVVNPQFGLCLYTNKVGGDGNSLCRLVGVVMLAGSVKDGGESSEV